MKLYGDNILVKELQDDFNVNGFILKYDDVNPFMFVEIINLPNDLGERYNELNQLNKDDIVIIKRIDKIPYIDGNYFISPKSIIASITRDEYNGMIFNK